MSKFHRPRDYKRQIKKIIDRKKDDFDFDIYEASYSRNRRKIRKRFDTFRAARVWINQMRHQDAKAKAATNP